MDFGDLSFDGAGTPPDVPDLARLVKTQFGSRPGVITQSNEDDSDRCHPSMTTAFDRYIITLPTLTFPGAAKKAATVKGEIVFTPRNDKIVGNGSDVNGSRTE